MINCIRVNMIESKNNIFCLYLSFKVDDAEKKLGVLDLKVRVPLVELLQVLQLRHEPARLLDQSDELADVHESGVLGVERLKVFAPALDQLALDVVYEDVEDLLFEFFWRPLTSEFVNYSTSKLVDIINRAFLKNFYRNFKKISMYFKLF